MYYGRVFVALSNHRFVADGFNGYSGDVAEQWVMENAL